MSITKEQEKIRDNWIADLRSGKYSQTDHRLFKEGQGYCCLGVLQHRLLNGNVETQGLNQYGEQEARECPSTNFYNLFDLSWVKQHEGFLTQMNDEGEMVGEDEYGNFEMRACDFNRIADYIEEKWV